MLSIICTIASSLLQAQSTFELAVDYDNGVEGATSVLAVDDGIIVLGNGPISGPYPNYGSIKILKLTFSGSVVWKKSYSMQFKTLFSGRPSNVKKVPWGGYVFAGSSIDTSGANHALLCVFDENGDTLFLREFPKSNTVRIGYSCLPLPDKGFLVMGLSNELGTAVDRFWAMRVDSTLNLIWDTVYTNNGTTSGFTAEYNVERDIILFGGYSQGMPWLMEVDSMGRILWQRKFVSHSDCGTYAKYTTDGGILFTGCLDTVLQGFYGGSSDQPDYVAKLDSNRNLEWRTFFPFNTDFQIIQSVRETTGGYLFGGFTGDNSIGVGWVGKLDYNGQLIWQRYYQHLYQGYNIYCELRDIDVAIDGGVLATGTTHEQTQDMWVLKLDTMGCLLPGCDTMPCRYPPCDTTGITETTTLQAKLYPNPTTGTLTIELPGGEGGSIALYNLLGQNVYQATLAGGQTTLALNLPPGLYLYRIGSGNQANNGKLLVE